jgi:hypothetical protein
MVSQTEKHRNSAQTIDFVAEWQDETVELRHPAGFFHFLFIIF